MNRVAASIVLAVRVLARVLSLFLRGFSTLIVRGTLSLGLMVGLVHFIIADPVCASYVSDIVSDSIPGTIRMQRIHASPLLREWSVVGVRIYSPQWQPIIQAERLGFQLQRKEFFRWLFALVSGEPGVELHLDKVRLFNGYVDVDTRHPELLPIRDTFVAPRDDSEDLESSSASAPLWIELSRISLENVTVGVQTPGPNISLNNVSVRGSLDIRNDRTEIRAQKARVADGEILFAGIPLLGGLPVSGFDAADVFVTTDKLVIGSFSTRVSDIELAGQGTMGLDARQIVDAKFRIDTTFGNPVLERLLPLTGDGLVSMVFEVKGALLEPQIEADLYAEDSQFGDLQLRQVGGRILWGKDLTGEGAWRYGLPRFKLLTQHGSVRVSGLKGRLVAGEEVSVSGSGLFRLRRLVPLALLKSLGVHVASDGIPEIELGGRAELSFHGKGDLWKLAPKLDLNVVLDGARELALRGNPNLQIKEGQVRIAAQDLEVWDDAVRVTLDGESVWPEGQLDLSIRGDIHKLRSVALPFAELPLDGAMHKVDLHLSGSLPVPAIDLRAQLKGVAIDGVEPLAGAIDASIGPEGRLELRRFEVKTGGFDVETVGELQLFAPGTWTLAPRLGLKLKNMSVAGDFADQNLVPELSGEVRAWSRKLYVDLLDPFKSIKGRLNLEGQHLSYQGFRLRTLEVAVDGKVNQLKLERLHAVLPGGAQVSVIGRIMDFRENVDLKVRVLDLNLTRLLSMSGLSPAEIPLVGFLRADVDVMGPIAAPRLRGTVTGMSVRYGQIKLGRVALGLRPLEAGGARLLGERLPPGFELEEPSLLRLGNGEGSLSLTVGFNEVDPLELLGVQLSEGLNKLKVALTGRSKVHVELGEKLSTEPLVRLFLPEGGLSLQGEPLEEPLHNPSPIEAWLAEGDLWLPNLQLRYGDADLFACGVYYSDGFLEAAVKGVVPLEVLTLQRAVFSDASGQAVLRGKENAILPAGLLLGCNTGMVNSTPPPATIQGTMSAALVDAELRLDDGAVSLRGLPQEIVIPDGSGFQLVGDIVGGDGIIELSTMGEDGFYVQFGDGTLALKGGLKTRNLELDSLDLLLTGSGVEAASPRTFRITSSPELRITGTKLGSIEDRKLRAEGNITISEGFYYRSFDAFARAVGNVFGRKMDAYSRPITESFPVLKDLELDLKVKSAAFQVASPFPFGQAELDLDVNASVRGTLGRPEVYDVVNVRPGSTIQYSIFEREFEIFEGTIEFRGDPSHPHIELAARTVTTYMESGDDSSISSRSEGVSIEREESVTITIRITGTYPELDIDFSSDRPEFDEADIQSLIFTGVPARRSGGSGDLLADSSVNLFAEDLTGLLSKLMLTPFLDSVSLGVNRLGGITAEFLTSLGRSLSVKTRVMQVGVDTRVDAGFRVQFSDRVSLEGKLKVLQEEQDQTRTYEAKLKYRIPLDE